MARDLGLGEAAKALGVSVDTLRRWDRAGKLRTTRDERNRRRVPRRDQAPERQPQRHAPGDRLSARNRFPGIVRSVEVDGVMALVEIEAGPHRVTAAITRDAVEELGLADGVTATAMVKATSVMVERGGLRATRIVLVAGGGGSRGPAGLRRRRRESQLTVCRGELAAPTRSRDTATTFHEADTRFSFAGSDVLAAQIQQGARPDVFASANTTYPDELYQEGLVEKPVVFAANRLVHRGPRDDSGSARSTTCAVRERDRPRVGIRAHRRLHARGAVGDSRQGQKSSILAQRRARRSPRSPGSSAS